VQLSPVDVRDAAEIEREITTFARLGNGGLIIQGSPLSLVHRELIIALAARHKLPAVYFLRPFVIGGGLISYGADLVDHSRRAAGYVDRILKGEKPADLPVQVPTIRAGAEPQDRQGARHRCAGYCVGTCCRSDRIAGRICCCDNCRE
jgi:putative ABC transport system substrate-binding protein